MVRVFRLFNPTAALPQRRLMGLILLIILVLVLVGAFPRWNYSRNWGYGPSGLMTVLLIVLIVLLLMDVIRFRF
jgi:hypothetical protein